MLIYRLSAFIVFATISGCAEIHGVTNGKQNYSPFYDQADHFRALLEKGDTDGAGRVYGDHRQFFMGKGDKYEKLLSTAIATHNEKWNARLDANKALCSSLVWPAERTKWSEIKQALTECTTTVQSYRSNPLVAGEFGSLTARHLESTLADIVGRISSDAPRLFF